MAKPQQTLMDHGFTFFTTALNISGYATFHLKKTGIICSEGEEQKNTRLPGGGHEDEHRVAMSTRPRTDPKVVQTAKARLQANVRMMMIRCLFSSSAHLCCFDPGSFEVKPILLPGE